MNSKDVSLANDFAKARDLRNELGQTAPMSPRTGAPHHPYS